IEGFSYFNKGDVALPYLVGTAHHTTFNKIIKDLVSRKSSPHLILPAHHAIAQISQPCAELIAANAFRLNLPVEFFQPATRVFPTTLVHLFDNLSKQGKIGLFALEMSPNSLFTNIDGLV